MNEIGQWLDHHGHEILYIDYSNLSGEKFVQTIQQRAAALVLSGKTEIKLLLDVTDSFADKDIVAAFKKASIEIKPQVDKIAVIGLTGVQKYFLFLVNQFSNIGAKSFEDRNEALDWLIE